MDYLTIALTIAAVVSAIYYFLLQDLDFFKKHNIIHMPPVPLLGNMTPFVFRSTPLAELLRNIYNIHPEAKYIGFFEFTQPIVVIRDPDIIKSIGVKNFENFPDHRTFFDEVQDPLLGTNLFALRGGKWKNVRSLLTPAFTSSKMKTMFTLMNKCAAGFVNFQSALPENNNNVELKEAFTRYANDVIASCAFGIDVDSTRNPTNQFYVYGRNATDLRSFVRIIKFFAIRSFPRLSRLLGLRVFEAKIPQFFKNIVLSTINERDEKDIHRPDMIQLMMESRGKKGSGKELTIDDMTAQAFLIFLGGFDTASTLMSFAAYELAINPNTHEKLQDEIDKVLEESNGQLTYEAVAGMSYLDAVVHEALRMYPAFIFIDRICANTFELPPALPGGRPFTVKKGMIVWLPIYGLHRDPKYFPNPDTFSPERFLDGSRKILNSSYYLPFGLGPRMCIANRFAVLETKVLLCNLLARCNLIPCSKTNIPVKLDRKGTALLPENGFWVKIEARRNPRPSVQLPVTNGKCKV